MAPYQPVSTNPTYERVPTYRGRIPRYKEELVQQILKYLNRSSPTTDEIPTYRTFRTIHGYKDILAQTDKPLPDYNNFKIPTYGPLSDFDDIKIPDIKIPTFKPNDIKMPDSTTKGSSNSSLSSIGIAITVVVMIFSMCCYFLKFYIRCKRRIDSRNTRIARPQDDGLNQPLISTEVTNVPTETLSQRPISTIGGTRLEEGTIPNLLQNSVREITHRNSPSRGNPPHTILTPTRLLIHLDDPIDVLIDPPPQPDVNNPYSMEAITDLVNLHQTRKSPALRIEVNRGTIVDDLIKIYKAVDQDQAHSYVFCKFTGEEGLDAGGVMKDLYTTFWDKAKDIYFRGNVAYVPQVNLRNYDLSVFVTLGRIFSHSTVLLRAVPLQICRTTLLGIIFGEMDMNSFVSDSSELIEDFVLYLDFDDRLLIRKAMEHFNDLDINELMKLQYIFETFEMTITPKEETLEANLSFIAFNELYVKPRVVCQKMGQGIPVIHRDHFWGHLTFRHIDALYEVFKPTPNMVIQKLLYVGPIALHTDERLAFKNLKRFISRISEDLLLKFLQFVTGERKVPCGLIAVQFTDLSGVARAPKSHTCINMLELPNSYTRFMDLKREFTSILMSDEAMQVNME